MPSECQLDHQKTIAYAPKIYHDPNMSEELREIYRTLEAWFVHEGRAIDITFYQDMTGDTLENYNRIGFQCLLSLDEEICPRFIMEFYKSLCLDRYLEDNRLFMTFDINGHEFNISLDQFVELTSLPNQDRVDKVLPYGMILTRLFKILKETIEDHPFDDRYVLVPRKCHPLRQNNPKRYLPRSLEMSYNRALPVRENMSNEQRETKGMFKNMAQAMHNFVKHRRDVVNGKG
ncbi:hypothetical protein Tco_0571353 [Tanacetum coccineum]